MKRVMKIIKKYGGYVALCITVLTFQAINGLGVGSNAVPSIEAYVEFPSTDTDNVIMGFAWMKNGFGLEDATTSCTFNAAYQISGAVNMNGGILYLNNNLIFDDPVLNSLGSIIGNDHSIQIGNNVSQLPADTTLLQEVSLYFYGNLDILSTITIKGHCVFDGSYNVLGLETGGGFVIDTGATLELRNLVLEGVGGNNLRCVDDTSHLILDGVTWCQREDMNFEHGDILVQRYVDFIGAVTFALETPMTCTIDNESTWAVDGGMMFKLGRKNSEGPEPLYLYNENSVVSLGECSLVTTHSGINLTRGRLEFTRNATIDAPITGSQNGTVIGDGVNAENDLTIYLGPGADINFQSGWLTYNNVRSDLFYAASPNSRFTRQSDSNFYIKKDCIYPENILEFNVTSQFPPTLVAPGATLFYNNTYLVMYGGGAFINGYRTTDASLVLGGNDSILVSMGEFMPPVIVTAQGNSIGGTGNIRNTLYLTDPTAQLSLGIQGMVFANIVLNGGSLTLLSNLQFGRGNTFAIGGTVNLSNYHLTFGTQDFTASAPINWTATDAAIDIRSALTLSTVWTFSGDVTIQGNNNELIFEPGAQIILQPNAHVTFKNVILKLADTDSIVCVDNTAQITLDEVYWLQSSDFVFAAGLLEIRGDVTMRGQGKTFTYQATSILNIAEEARWTLNQDFTFNYVPTNEANNLITFVADSSKLFLNGAILAVGVGGLQLTGGQCEIIGDSTINTTKIDLGNWSYTDNGITFGDDIPAHDCYLMIVNHANLNIMQGSLNFRNASSNRSLYLMPGSTIYIGSDATLRVYQTMNIGNGTIVFDGGAALERVPGKTIKGSVSPIGSGSFGVVDL